MRILILTLLLFSLNALAEVSRNEAELMIDQMVQTNMISKEEAEKAKVRLHSMSASDWSKVNKVAEKKAAAEIGRGPASVDIADPSSDLNAEQMSAIHSDLKKISTGAN
jgi:hypothetical protein